MPIVHVVRHGPTDFNDEDRLRGWMDPPLNAAGLEMARRIEVPEHLPVFSSDLLRAIQTAEAIGLPFTRVPELRPWNVGVFQGHPGRTVHRRLIEYFNNPAIRVPFGEPWNEFQARLLGWVGALICDCIVVTHFRCCRLLLAWAAAGYRDVDRGVMLEDASPVTSVFTLELPGSI